MSQVHIRKSHLEVRFSCCDRNGTIRAIKILGRFSISIDCTGIRIEAVTICGSSGFRVHRMMIDGVQVQSRVFGGFSCWAICVHGSQHRLHNPNPKNSPATSHQSQTDMQNQYVLAQRCHARQDRPPCAPPWLIDPLTAW